MMSFNWTIKFGKYFIQTLKLSRSSKVISLNQQLLVILIQLHPDLLITEQLCSEIDIQFLYAKIISDIPFTEHG